MRGQSLDNAVQFALIFAVDFRPEDLLRRIAIKVPILVGSVLEDARDANASNNAHEQRRDYVITVVAIQLTTSFAQNMYAVIKKLYNEIGR